MERCDRHFDVIFMYIFFRCAGICVLKYFTFGIRTGNIFRFVIIRAHRRGRVKSSE